MFSVSEKSQVNRLHELLVNDSILVNGVVQKAPHDIGSKKAGQISSIVAYLSNVHGYDRIQPWFKESLKKDSTGSGVGYKDPSYVTELMGLEFNPAWRVTPPNTYIYNIASESPIDIAGYDHMVRIWYPGSSTEPKGKKDKSGFAVSAFADSLIISVARDDKATDSLTLKLIPLADSMIQRCGDVQGRSIAADKAMMEYSSANLRAKVVLMHVFLEMAKDSIKPVNYDAVILYSSGQEKK